MLTQITAKHTFDFGFTLLEISFAYRYRCIKVQIVQAFLKKRKPIYFFSKSSSRPFRRQITGLVLNVSFWPELEHKMTFVYARNDDVALASF